MQTDERGGITRGVISPPLINLRHEAILRFLQEAGLKPGMDVYEIGCGTAAVTKLIADFLDGDGTLLAVDLVINNAVRTRDRLADHITDLTVRAVDAVSYEPGRDFDVIALPDVVEHIAARRHRKLFRTVAEHLRPDGFVFVNTPHPRLLEWIRLTRPWLLQKPYDEPVQTVAMLTAAEAAGLYLRRMETYTVWDQDDYQAYVLGK